MSVAANRTPTFYGIFKMSLSFIPKSKDIASFFHYAHRYFSWLFIAVIIIHILAAIKHHFIEKDDVLTRILPGKY